MATVYVNNTAQTDNGWGVGDDTRNYATAQDKSTPWASLTEVRAQATAMQPDDIVIIYGTEANPSTHTDTNFTIADALDWRAENEGFVTFQTDAGTSRTVNMTQPNKFTGIIFDANGMNYGVYFGNIAGQTQLINCQVINWALQGVFGQDGLKLENTQITTTTASTSSDIQGVRINANRASTESLIEMDADSKITISHTAASGSIHGIFIKPIGTDDLNVNAQIIGDGVKTLVDITTVNAAVVVQHIRFGDTVGRSISDIIVRDVVSRSQGPSTDVGFLEILNDIGAAGAPITTATCEITGNNCKHTGSTPTSGRGILIGTDSNSAVVASSLFTASGFLCQDNDIENVSHGIEVGGCDGLIVKRNVIRECDQSTIHKRSDACQFRSNEVYNPRQAAFRFKSSTNCVIDNSIIVVDKDINTDNNGLLQFDNDGDTASSGNVTQNCSVYFKAGAVCNRVIHGDADSVGEWTANNNNYYAVDGWGTSAAAAFANINAVTYTFDTYQAAFETTATELNNPVLSIGGSGGGTSQIISNNIIS